MQRIRKDSRSKPGVLFEELLLAKVRARGNRSNLHAFFIVENRREKGTDQNCAVVEFDKLG